MNNIRIPKELIESDLTDLEFYLYVLFKAMQENENLPIITSINALNVHIGYKNYYKLEKTQNRMKQAIINLVKANIIFCLPIPLVELSELLPMQNFEVIYNKNNPYERNKKSFIEVNENDVVKILRVQTRKIRLLRQFFSLRLLQEKLRKIQNGNKQR